MRRSGTQLAALLWLLCQAVAIPRALAQVDLSGPAPAAAPRVTRAPTLVHQIAPVYPPAAYAERLAGDVGLAIDIDAEGQVTQVKVTQAAGHGFDEAALAAARQFRFTAAEVDGRPAAVQIAYVQHFAADPPVPVPRSAPPVPISLRGRVVERGSRVAIAGAAVLVIVGEAHLEPVITDADGRFEVRAPPGHASIQVRDVAHQPFDTEEDLGGDEQVEATYHLMPRIFGNFESVVRGRREKKEVTRHTLQREELQAVPGSFGDPLRVILNLPGLARTPYAAGGLVVRGAAAYDTGSYFDGVQLPLLFHFVGGPSVVNSEFIDRIDFYPGCFGARYGRAIGGVVDVESRTERPYGVHGAAKIDLLDTGVYLSVPLSSTATLSVAARRSYLDFLLGLVLRASGSSQRISPVYYDYQARLDWRPRALPNHRFKIFLMGSDDVLSVPSAVPTDTSLGLYFHQFFTRLSGQWTYQRDATTLKTVAFVGLDGLRLGVGVGQINYPATLFGLRQDTEVILHPRLSLRGGLDWQLRQGRVSFKIALPVDSRPSPGALPSAPLENIASQVVQFDFGQWLEMEIRVPHGLRLLPSLRLDIFRSFGHTQLVPQPRLVLRQELDILPLPTVAKGSIGLYSELPSGQFSNPLVGNPSMPAQRALQMSLGLEQRLTPTLGVDLTGFWNWRTSLAAPSARINTAADGSVRPENYAATGTGEAYGLEFLLRQELTQKFFGWVAYTLSWAKQRNDAAAAWDFMPYDERHILTVLGQYRFGNGWQFGGRFRLATSMPLTSVTDATYVADKQAYMPIYAVPGSSRGQTFHQLDLRVDRVWLFNSWQLGVYLDVQNVYARQNINSYVYDYRYQGREIVADLPILPTLGFKGVF